MFHQADLFEASVEPARGMDTPGLLAIAAASPRPNLPTCSSSSWRKSLTKRAGLDRDGERRRRACPRLAVRCAGSDRAAYTLAPFDDRNRAVGTEQADELPADPTQADRVIEERVRERVRQSGRCNVSRAVSDLCRGGLRRHYQGYRVDHQNRAPSARQSTRSCRTPWRRYAGDELPLARSASTAVARIRRSGISNNFTAAAVIASACGIDWPS
jgi:hypothetical protein